MGAFESGQSLIAGVLAKLPAELQAQAKAVFDAAEAKDAITTIGDSALARSDYSKQMDALRQQQTDLETQRQTLDRWYSVNKPALDEYVAYKPQIDKLKAGGTLNDDDDSGGTGVKKPITPTVNVEDFRKISQEQIDAVAPDMVGIAAWMSAKAVEHQTAFGEIPDLSGIVNDAMKIRATGKPCTLDDAYRAKYGEKLTERATMLKNKEIESLVEKRLAEERAKNPGGQPFPLRSEPSVLDVLSQTNGNKPDPSAYTVDAAVAEYTRLQSLRTP